MMPGETDEIGALVDAEVAAAVSVAQAEMRAKWAADVANVQAVALAQRNDAVVYRAEVERLREGVRALADEWGSGVVARLTADHAAAELRALLAHPPAATTGEVRCYGSGARCDEHGGRWDGTGRCLRADVNSLPAPVLGWASSETGGAVSAKPGWWLHAPVSSGEKRCDRCGNPLGDALDSDDHVCPAPVSSGEAATGEAQDLMRCDGCGVPEVDCPGLPKDACCCKVCAHYPAPVVTPSAEDGE